MTFTAATLSANQLAAIAKRPATSITRACRLGKIPCEIVTAGSRLRYRIPNTPEAIAAARKVPRVRAKAGRPKGVKDVAPVASFGAYRVVPVRPGVFKLLRRGHNGKVFCHGASARIVIAAADIPEIARAGLRSSLAKNS